MCNAMQCCPTAYLLLILSVMSSLDIVTSAVPLARERDEPCHLTYQNPGIIIAIQKMGSEVSVLVWLSLAVNIAVVLPTVVVPVLMMVLFKPIWSAVKDLLTCKRCRALAHGELGTGRTAII